MTRAPIAIVGVSLRLPGASDLDALWRLLVAGKRAITPFPKARFDIQRYLDPHHAAPGKIVTERGGFLDDFRAWDHAFFGISEREARAIDPQQLLVLELVHEALEDAGIPRERLQKSATGVFVGASSVDARFFHLPPFAELDGYSATGLTLNSIANRVSYTYDLKGPSFSVDSACSASLSALHMACMSLWAEECDAAFAAGVTLHLAPPQAISESQAGMLSPSGRCRAFDKDADGTVRGEGAVVLLLKPLAAAERDGDPVHGLVAATAANHNGRTQGISQTSSAAQAALLRTLTRAQPGHTIGYVEAHGTGMPSGDAVELKALCEVVGRSSGEPCYVGSLKPNIGHLEPAAGLAGLVKALLVLREQAVPPQVDFSELPDGVLLEPHNLVVPRVLTPCRTEAALVNGLGFSGANAAALLLRAPPPHVAPARKDTPWVLPLSAADQAALVALSQATVLPTDDAAATAYCAAAASERSALKEAVIFAAPNRAALARALAAFQAKEPTPHGVQGTRAQPRALVFAFPGHGPDWRAVHTQLGDDAPVFHEVLLHCDALVQSLAGFSVKEELLREASRLTHTDVAQPVFCAVQLALVAQLQAWGVRPNAVVGHSGGEMAAAACAGLISADDALNIAVIRGRHMHVLHGQGTLYALVASAERADLLVEEFPAARVAAYNSPKQCLIAIKRGDEAHFEALLDEQSIDFQPLDFAYPFHTDAIDSQAAAFTEDLRGVQARPGTIPMISSATAEPLDGGTLDSDYWYRQARVPVLFARAAQALARTPGTVFLEIGPDATLTRLLRQAQHDALPVLKDGLLSHSVAELSARGVAVDWRTLFGPRSAHAPLPHYPWQRRDVWRFQPYEREASGVSASAHETPRLYTLTQAPPPARPPSAPRHPVVLRSLSRAVDWKKLHARHGPLRVVLNLQSARTAALLQQLRAIVAAELDARILFLRPRPEHLGLVRSFRLEHRHLYEEHDAADAAMLTPVSQRRPLPVRFLPDASYLISGGLGVIGYGVAEALADAGAGRVILLSRRKLPPRSNTRHPDIRRLHALEARGIEVAHVSCDVTSTAALQRLLRDETRNGRRPIRGVFHCAVVEQHAPIIELTASQVDAARAVKQGGLMALHAVLPKLDFLVAVSSLAALTGGVWQGAYAAANTALEASVHALKKGRVVSIGLGPVRAGDSDARLASAATVGHRPLALDEAVSAILAATDPTLPRQLYTLAGDPVRISRALGDPALFRAVAVRPHSAANAQPLSKHAQTLLELARTVLGPTLGPDDDWFELGASSLTVVHIITAARAHGLAIDPRDVFRAPTVRTLAATEPTPSTRSVSVTLSAKQKRLIDAAPHTSLLSLRGHDMESLLYAINAAATSVPALRLSVLDAGGATLGHEKEALDPDQIITIKRTRLRGAERELSQHMRALAAAGRPLSRFVIFADGFFTPTHLGVLISPAALTRAQLSALLKRFR